MSEVLLTQSEVLERVNFFALRKVKFALRASNGIINNSDNSYHHCVQLAIRKDTTCHYEKGEV